MTVRWPARTETIRIDPHRPAWASVRKAALAIRRGEVIAIPTDTVYGLAGDPFRPGLAERIFAIKKRASDQPILLLVASQRDLEGIVKEPPPLFYRLAARFWPGPLTMILQASDKVPRAITAGTGKVAVRWPQSAWVRALAREAGGSLTGTSANLSGRPPAVTAAELEKQFRRRVYYVVDGGRARRLRPSTIVDLTDRPRIVREGVIPAAQLAVYLQ